MPAKAPPVAESALRSLQALGQQIRARRKALGVSGTAAAESAGMSRVTWHRIEKGEPAVAAGAYANAMAALGLEWRAGLPDEASGHASAPPEGWLPARVRIADFPQLARLAWQVHGTDTLSPQEALSIYERNWRHVDESSLLPHERALLESLRLAFAAEPRGV